MKIIKLSFFFFIIISVFSCSKKEDTKNEIIGKYYVLDYKGNKNFTLLKEKPNEEDVLLNIIYEFDFKENGDILIKDLTSFYDCGNGMLVFDKSNWEKKNDFYKLTFTGEYLGVEKFKEVTIYSLSETNKAKYLKVEDRMLIRNIISELSN